MRDLKDLDAAWKLLEQRADAYPLGEPAAPVVSLQRRWTLVACASAAVVATAVAVPLVVTRGGDDRSVPAASSAHLTTVATGPTASATPNAEWSALPKDHYLFVFDRMPGTRIRSVIGVGTDPTALPHSDTYQEVQTVGPHGQLVFKVNAPGAWAPPADATQTTVDGRTAYYGRFLLHPEIPGHPVHPRVALAWQYVPGSWATVADMSLRPIPLEKGRQLAGLVHIGDGGAIPNPAPGS